MLVRAAHPRSRGENSVICSWATSAPGSSPLTRGKLVATPTSLRRPRLIPAHAGKTTWVRRPSGRPRAHPRSRGENSMCRQASSAVMGSSPLTRGKRVEEQADQVGVRLIPAHAGKTRRGTPIARSRPAHPRSRGENVRLDVDVQTGHGSSPLTRGKRHSRHQRHRGCRLIPAHAGKTRRTAEAR